MHRQRWIKAVLIIALLWGGTVWGDLMDKFSAAEQGDASAQFKLGRRHEKGEGLPKNYSEALKWYLKAAEQGHIQAQANVGVFYHNGWGIRQNYAEALKWYRKAAAELRSAVALYGLGYMYHLGQGVPQDHVEAYKWYILAEKIGHQSARLAMDRLRPLMTREQVAEAQKLASVQFSFDVYQRFAKENKQKKLAGTRKIQWIGKLTEKEKNELRDFFDHVHKEFDLWGSQVLKSDLDGDGKSEYVIHTLLIEDPKPYRLGEVLGVINKKTDKFNVTIIHGPYVDTASIQRKLQVFDLDGDGVKDIIVQYEYESYGEQPSHSATIYRNERTSFRMVYGGNMDDWLTFEDLDGDGQLEILEAVNEGREGEVSSKYYWVNIYQWEGSTFKTNPSEFLNFYLRKENVYRQKMLERTGWSGPSRKTLQTYIQRIEAMKGKKK